MLLKNKYGNVQVIVNTESEIAAYKNKGYTEVKEETKPFTPKRKPKEEKE